MYLGAAALFGPIKINNMIYYSVDTSVDQALFTGAQVTSADGSHVYQVQRFQVPQQFGGGAGWLLDGCPLNVIFGQGWITTPDQIGALKAAGVVPTCLTPGTREYIQFFGPGAPAPSSVHPLILPPLDQPPNFTQIAAPQYTGPSYTPSGQRILSTGVQAPAPTIISIPGQPPQILPPEIPQQGGVTTGGLDWMTVLLVASFGLAALSFMRTR